MRHRRWVSLAVVFVLVGAAGLAAAARAEEPSATEAELGKPFTLVAREMAKVGPDGLEITLRSVSDDSGCSTPTDCSLRVFNGSFAMRQGEESDLAQVSAIMQPNSAVKVTFAGYEIDIIDVRRADRKSPVVVTFQVDREEAEGKDEP
jgi:hypothetical protein